MIFFFLNFLQNLQCFPSQTLCSGKQAFVWNSPLGGHGVQRDSGTVEQTLKAPQLGLNSWEVALLFSKSSPSGWLRQGNQLGSCRGCSVVGLGRGSGAAAELLPGAVTSNPGEMFPVAESWCGCRESQGMFPLGLGRYLCLQPRPRRSRALTKNKIQNQTRKETAKRCHCTTLRLRGAVPVGCQLFQHPLCNPSAHDMEGEGDWERAGTRQLLELGKGQPEGEAAPGWCRALA